MATIDENAPAVQESAVAPLEGQAPTDGPQSVPGQELEPEPEPEYTSETLYIQNLNDKIKLPCMQRPLGSFIIVMAHLASFQI